MSLNETGPCVMRTAEGLHKDVYTSIVFCSYSSFSFTYSDTTEIGVLHMPENHIQEHTVVVGELF